MTAKPKTKARAAKGKSKAKAVPNDKEFLALCAELRPMQKHFDTLSAGVDFPDREALMAAARVRMRPLIRRVIPYQPATAEGHEAKKLVLAGAARQAPEWTPAEQARAAFDAIMGEWQAEWERFCNPVTVWQAIQAWVRRESSGGYAWRNYPLPDWVAAYLSQAARRIDLLSRRHDFREFEWKEGEAPLAPLSFPENVLTGKHSFSDLIQLVPEALGFLDNEINMLLQYEDIQKKINTVRNAQHAGETITKGVERLAEWRGQQPSSVWKQLRAGRELLKKPRKQRIIIEKKPVDGA